MALAEIEFTSYEESVHKALQEIKLEVKLRRRKKILVKPNLIGPMPPPITTPVECVEAVIHTIRECSNANIVIAEGCGAIDYETDEVFDQLGYRELAKRLKIKLIDLNKEPTVVLRDPSCRVFPEFYMPAIAMDSLIINVPVLKAHTLAGITGAMKNMMGFAPPEHYQQEGFWKKAVFHEQMHESIIELNRYRKPDITVMDATIGMPEAHLDGPECDPPVNKILAGDDPLELDRAAARLLDIDWREVPHLT